jgi:hypothetical protein
LRRARDRQRLLEAAQAAMSIEGAPAFDVEEFERVFEREHGLQWVPGPIHRVVLPRVWNEFVELVGGAREVDLMPGFVWWIFTTYGKRVWQREYDSEVEGE